MNLAPWSSGPTLLHVTEGKNIYFGAVREEKSHSLRNRAGKLLVKIPDKCYHVKGSWNLALCCKKVLECHAQVWPLCIWECRKILWNLGLTLLNALSLLQACSQHKVKHHRFFFFFFFVRPRPWLLNWTPPEMIQSYTAVFTSLYIVHRSALAWGQIGTQDLHSQERLSILQFLLKEHRQ